jgi:hypothetical protein
VQAILGMLPPQAVEGRWGKRLPLLLLVPTLILPGGWLLALVFAFLRP